ncbi:MAG TPA: response regulator transcription factor, partial [Chitinophagaceae bacterium]|nr:response regulator transcription factor [Chitinophagaceae bacterium]
SEVLQAVTSGQVHYAILDMFMPDGNMFPVIQQVRDISPHTSILIYSMSAEKVYARRLLQNGVRGFVSKQASIGELENALRGFLKGDIYLSAEVKDILLKPVREGLPDNPIDLLSDRELEVVEYIVMGLGSKEIAQKMNLDITTVSTYRRRALEKLEVENVVELKDKFLLYKMA